MAEFSLSKPNHFIIILSISIFSLFNNSDAGIAPEKIKLRAGMKFSHYYNADADSLDLPTLDAYDTSLMAPSPYDDQAPITLISTPPDTSPSPSPFGLPPISDPPQSEPIPSPIDPYGPHIGPKQATLVPTGAPRHSWAKDYAVWCVARPTVPETMLQRAMDYACGNGADCGSVSPNGSCFVPNNVVAHASYAFNSYWQRTKIVGGTCDFGGTAMLITDDPSFNGCHFIYN